MSNIDDVLFWIHEEPIDGPEEDLYLAADTPIHNPSGRLLYQKQVKEQKREQRKLLRANHYYYSKFKSLLQSTAKEVQSKIEPEESLTQLIQIKDSSDFFQSSQAELSDLLGYISNVKAGKVTTFPNINQDTSHYEKPKLDKEEEKFNYKWKQILEEYTVTQQSLKPNHEHTPIISTETLHTPEPSSILPRDPRLR